MPAVELKSKDAVRRILEAAGATVSDKKAFWLGHHRERFVNHTRKRGELLELPAIGHGCISGFDSPHVCGLADGAVGVLLGDQVAKGADGLGGGPGLYSRTRGAM